MPVRTIFTNTGTGYLGTFEKEDLVHPGCDARTLSRKCTHLSVNAHADRQRGHAHCYYYYVLNLSSKYGHHTWCRGARPVLPWACLPRRRLGPLHRVFPLKREKVAPAWQARPWEHRPSSSAPCAVPMGPSTIGQHIKDEPCAKQRAFLGIFFSRYSSRFSRCPILGSIFSCLPLVI